jgi:hypothetical protein
MRPMHQKTRPRFVCIRSDLLLGGTTIAPKS